MSNAIVFAIALNIGINLKFSLDFAIHIQLYRWMINGAIHFTWRMYARYLQYL